MSDGPRRILEAVRRVPAGSVATYGQVARLAGLPGSARQVGYALARLDDGSDVPWQRIVRADGSIAERGGTPRRSPSDVAAPVSCGARRQRERLEDEGIEFGPDGRVDLGRFRWRPDRRAAPGS